MNIGSNDFYLYRLSNLNHVRAIKKIVSAINLKVRNRVSVFYDTDSMKFVIGIRTGFFYKVKRLQDIFNKLKVMLRFVNRHYKKQKWSKYK